ncbi:MAG: hypothetical protein K6F42_03460 [Bacteroidales bacterium]|nr:hypothetical protein [Bacteroidales bacterium]
MIRVRIVTPQGTLYACDNARGVFLPGTLGPFEVLKGHAPIISSLEAGEVRCLLPQETKAVRIASGFAEVKDDTVTVCAEV